MQNERHKIISHTVDYSAGTKERLRTQKKYNDKTDMMLH